MMKCNANMVQKLCYKHNKKVVYKKIPFSKKGSKQPTPPKISKSGLVQVFCENVNKLVLGREANTQLPPQIGKAGLVWGFCENVYKLVLGVYMANIIDAFLIQCSPSKWKHASICLVLEWSRGFCATLITLILSQSNNTHSINCLPANYLSVNCQPSANNQL